MPGMDGFINFNGTLEGSIAGGGGGDVTDVKVRDSQETTFESVVNEEGVAEIDLISYVRRNELTQAIENVENSIDNVEELVDTKQNIIDYSTEQVIGIWIDGKPLYQKTIDKIYTTSNHQIITLNEIDSTMDCKNYKGRFDYEYDNVFYPSALGSNLNMYPADSFDQLKILKIMEGQYRVRVIITVEYTKTTD